MATSRPSEMTSTISRVSFGRLALVVQQFAFRGPTAAHLACLASPDSIIGVANSFWDLVPFRGDQKLFPHFGQAGTAVFAIKNVEYGGHDLTPLFDLHHKLQAIIPLGVQ